MNWVLCELNKAREKMKEAKKAYLKPEATLVRFSAEDVLTTSNDLPHVGEHETPVVLFNS